MKREIPFLSDFLYLFVLICIKMVCGTFFFLGAIASDFLDKISNIKTLVKSISQGGARPPLLSTRLIGLDGSGGGATVVRLQYGDAGSLLAHGKSFLISG